MGQALQPALAGRRDLYERRRPEETTLYRLQGGGVASFGYSGTLTQVRAPLIAANTGTDVDLVFSGTNSFDSDGNNLIGDGDATGAFNQGGDQTGVADPGLGPLADNGGPTQPMPRWPAARPSTR